MATQTDRRLLWTHLWKSLDTSLALKPNEKEKLGLNNRAPYLPRKTTTSKLPDPQTWIGGILLSVWDNVAGPRIEHSWMGPGDQPPQPPQPPQPQSQQNSCSKEEQEAAEQRTYLAEQMQQMIARDTLAGTLEDSLVVKLVAQPHVDGNVVVSVAFSAPYLSNDRGALPTKFSVALFAKRTHVNRVTGMYRIIEDRLMYLALCARVAYTKCAESGDAIERINKEVLRAAEALDSAMRAGLEPPTDDSLGRALIHAATSLGVEFLARALTSHLQTRGFTVVLGPDKHLVDTIIEILAAFLDPRDLALSTKASAKSVYRPDLVLQGVVASDSNAGGGVSEEQLIQAPLPTTVIHLTGDGTAAVYQPRAVTEFVSTRRDYYKIILANIAPSSSSSSSSSSPSSSSFDSTMSSAVSSVSSAPLVPPSSVPPSTDVDATNQSSHANQEGINDASALASVSAGGSLAEAKAALQDSSSSNSSNKSGWLPKDGLLIPVQQSSSLVFGMLLHLLRLPPPLRLSYALFADKLFACKAMTLLKLLTSDMREHKGASQANGRWLKENLNLTEDADLNVLLAYAEKLQPGISMSMLADRLTLEEKFIELFEGFV